MKRRVTIILAAAAIASLPAIQAGEAGSATSDHPLAFPILCRK